jgi:putative transposase
MPRLARLDAPGVLHHVMGRGIEKNNIFLNKKDRNDFINRLSVLVDEGAIEIYAWALMTNHFHILLKTKNRPLSSSMRKILTGYVVNFNRRHKRYGHLFQNRYKSIVCQEDAYLMELVRYIHLNLLRGGVVKDLNGLNDSPWSGHSALLGRLERKWQDTEYVLSYFGNKRVRRKNYYKYVMEGIDLVELCNRVCKKRNVSLTELLSGSRRREPVNARRIISWLTVHKLGYSGAEVARHLGVTTSCITRFLSSGKKPDIEGII